MKKTTLVTIGSLLAVFGYVATAATQTGCKLTIVDSDAAVLGDGGGGGGGGDTGGGGNSCTGLNNVSFDDANDNCDTCMGTSCCTEVTTCFGDTTSDCTEVYKCIAGCNDDQKCEDDCKTKVSADGVTQLNAVIGCLTAKCDPQCPAQ
jgi:hypothetical protein